MILLLDVYREMSDERHEKGGVGQGRVGLLPSWLSGPATRPMPEWAWPARGWPSIAAAPIGKGGAGSWMQRRFAANRLSAGRGRGVLDVIYRQGRVALYSMRVGLRRLPAHSLLEIAPHVGSARSPGRSLA